MSHHWFVPISECLIVNQERLMKKLVSMLIHRHYELIIT